MREHLTQQLRPMRPVANLPPKLAKNVSTGQSQEAVSVSRSSARRPYRRVPWLERNLDPQGALAPRGDGRGPRPGDNDARRFGSLMQNANSLRLFASLNAEIALRHGPDRMKIKRDLPVLEFASPFRGRLCHDEKHNN